MTNIIIATLFIIAIFATMIMENKSYKKEKENVKIAPKPLVYANYDELIAILNSVVKQEIHFKIKLEYDLKNVKIISFEDSLMSLSKAINDAISTELMSELEKYHSRAWILEYIVKNVKIFLLEYMKANTP